MKIVVYAPHPDDEVFGCGGSILKWLNEGHDVHVIYITDNRALLRDNIEVDDLIQEDAMEFLDLDEDQIAEIALKEAEIVAKNFGIPRENVHFFKIHDMDAENNIDLGVSLSKVVLKGADRIVVSSHNNRHPDHQATNLIAKRAVKDLNLKDIEFYVYSIYVSLKVPKEKLIKVKISDYRDKLHELMKGYRSQLCFKNTRNGWEYLKRKRIERFGLFELGDEGKFFNF